MLFHTHLAFAFLVGVFFLPYLAPANPILFIAIVLFAGILPDIDHSGSKIGKRVKIIGWLFEHRGFFHSALGIAFFTLLFYLIFNTLTYATAFLLGYASHILIDSITDSGVMFLHPFSRKRLRGFLRSGAFYEHAIFLVILAAGIIRLVSLH